ncbi:ferric iron uptake transcriptional regulator [Isobaculum melis]|uniref:Fur family transcriptional regulator, ferric uptake regulator n=1 Tax=Isobaculum melis TaxID=142588 RepID=A0A1H9R986_9LACT|nr:Fur family transcriptional regulator [Isobaculum melis]SER68503.1 Fur family transcriptional regulator, ferric uptake regulator [Isobaculum melis]
MNATSPLAGIKEQLHTAGYKLTPQREATVLVLVENEKEHLSAEEIYMCVKEKSPEIGLATVYRTLELLTELHVVNKITFNDGLARYDVIKEGGGHFHHHLLCTSCGNIEEVQEDLLEEVEQKIENQFQFLIQDHRLTFHGLCKDCQKKAN